jgi:peptidyl-prolyl cis-trans isomerase C
MPFLFNPRTALCAVLFVAAGALGARAQDANPAVPAPAAPAAEAPAAPASPAAPAAEAPAPAPDTVVARVGDATITEQDLAIAREEFGGELGRVPPEQHRAVLIDALVNMELLAQAAHAEGLDQGPDFEARLAFMKRQASRNAYVEKVVVNSVTDADMEKGYQDLVVKEFKPEEQLHGRHILVETKEAAEKIIADLKAGGAFEELAKQSKDPSGQNGGDLGFFGRGQMVGPFEEAAFKLQPGQITEAPVQTEFGWHVIKVEEKRMSSPPALDEVREELRNYLLKQKFDAAMAALREATKVEVIGAPADAPAAPAQAAPSDAPAAPADAVPAPAPEAAPAPAPAPAQ